MCHLMCNEEGLFNEIESIISLNTPACLEIGNKNFTRGNYDYEN